MPEVDLRDGAKSVDEVLAEFDSRRDHFAATCKDTKRLVEKILDERQIPIQSVQARVKARNKLKSKYCDGKKNYKCLDEISDLVGIRIITYYSDKIDQIASIIRDEFAEHGPPEDKRTGRPDTFGYSAIHLDCKYSAARLERTEYKRFSEARFEIQITTILGHAWAEMHHPWYDELNSPTEEVRRFHRLAAVLELAEQEFLEIRTKKDNRERNASVRVAANTPEIPVNSETIKAFLEQNKLVSELDLKFLAVMGGENLREPVGSFIGTAAQLLNAVGIDTIQKLEDQLKSSGANALKFLNWRRSRGKAKPIPTLPKGLSLAHIANFLALTSGAEKYNEFCVQVNLEPTGGVELPKLVAAAQQISRGLEPTKI